MDIVFSTTETTATVQPDGRKDMRLEERAHRHLSWVQANRSASTYMVRRYCVQAFLEYMGACLISEITRLRLSEFQAWSRQHHQLRKSGCGHHLREVRTMLRWAEEFEVCDVPVRRFPAVQSAPPRTLRFTDEEITKLLDGSPEGGFRDMLVFGLLLPKNESKSKTGQKVAAKVAANSDSEKEAGGCVAATACQSTS